MVNKNQDVTYGVLNWGPCVMHLKISEEFHQKLLKGAEEARATKITYQHKLAGIIKEEYEYKDIPHYLPEVAQCLGVYDAAYERWKNQKYKQKPEYVLTSLWVNYMKRYEYNPPHDHSDNLSFVIFLKVPEEIKKEQENYIGQSGGPGSLMFTYGDGDRDAITYQAVQPKERDIFIFPAWLKHYVVPFYSDVTRISVAGNVASSIKLNQLRDLDKAKLITNTEMEEKLKNEGK